MHFTFAPIKRRFGHPWLVSIGVHVLASLLVVSSGAESLFLRGSLFTDVPPSHPHEEAISWLEDQGIIRGRSDGSFGPEDEINRAEFVRLLINVSGLKSRAGACLQQFREAYGTKARFLRDVVPDAWYEGDVCAALERGIVKGFDDQTFRPDQPVSFAEAAVMLSRAYGLPLPASDPKAPWYKPSVQALSEKNAIPNDVVSFTASVSRAIVAEMVYRVATPVSNLPSLSFEKLEMQTGLHAAAPSLEDRHGELLALINATRWQYGLPAVQANVALTNAAALFAKNLNVRGAQGHQGADGSLPPDRIKAAGYEAVTLESCNCTSIEYHYGEVLTKARMPAEALELFLASDVHRPIILSKVFDEAGVGINEGMYVVDFASTVVGF